MLNYIWLAMLLVAVIVGGFTGRMPDVVQGAFEGAKKAVMDIALPLMGVWAIWLGIMRLAERSGLVSQLATALRPIMRRLFPEVPVGHPAHGAMVMNMAANLLGLGNAATPLGLRAMRLLESLNPRPGVATNAMCVFLALNTASIQILPLTAIGLLTVHGAKNAYAITISAFLATLFSASAGVLASKFFERLPVFRIRGNAGAVKEPTTSADDSAEKLEVEKVEAAPLTALGKAVLWLYSALFVVFFAMLAFGPSIDEWLRSLNPQWHLPPLPKELADRPPGIRVLMSISLLALPFLLSFFPLYAALRGVKVYEQFVTGAKEAWTTAQSTVPYLVAMLVAIGMLQKAGVIAELTKALRPALNLVGFPAELLPMVLMRPLSGSATNGLFNDLLDQLKDPDGFISRLAGTIYGSTETTFYVLAVYFGSVAIRQTRHAVAAGLTADFAAVVASLVICRLLFL
jgi:spore maturation protein SpmA